MQRMHGRGEQSSTKVPDTTVNTATAVRGANMERVASPTAAPGVLYRVPLALSLALLAALACPGGARAQAIPDADHDLVILAARSDAKAFADALPDYIVKLTTTRYRGSRSEPSGRNRKSTPLPAAFPWIVVNEWRTLDTISRDLAMDQGKEIFTDIHVNGKPAKSLPENGVWSVGEFSTAMAATVAPQSAAVFKNRQSGSIGDRQVYRYDYVIDQTHSIWHLAMESPVGRRSTYSMAYDGAIWIDRQTGQVLRLEMTARHLPPFYGMDTVESAIDYDFVKIGDVEYVLPTKSESYTCQRNSDVCFRNQTVFRDYDKFGARSTITFVKNPE